MGSECAGCQVQFVYEDPLINGEFSFSWYPCVVLPILLQLLLTRSRANPFLQYVDPTLQKQLYGPGTCLDIRVARKCALSVVRWRSWLVASVQQADGRRPG